MRFAYPEWLFALFALPLVAGWMVWVDVLRRRRLTRYAEPALWPSVAATVGFRTKRIQAALRLLALAFAILAVAHPQWGIKERPVVRHGSDIIICLDVSNSMLAADLPPSRLENAKMQIKSLIHNLQGDRIGLVLFAGESYVLCPLTTDYRLAAGLLDGASVESVAVQGTRIGSAIDTARQAFDRSALGTKSIILVTDGEDHESEPLEAARRAAREGIVIECVGIGSTESTPILLPSGRYKTDREGRTITTRLDAELLRDIALTTGGRAIVTDRSGDMALESLYASIKNYERRQLETVELTMLEDRYQWPLGVALLLLALELFLGLGARRPKEDATGGGGRWRRWTRWLAGPAGCALCLALAPAQAEANQWDFGNRAARLCEEGNLALSDGEYDEAISRYRDAKMSAPHNPVLDYNIGVALAKKGELERARVAFLDAFRNAMDNPKIRAKASYSAAYARFAEALGFLEQNKIDEALRAVGESIDKNREALQIDPDLTEARENLLEAIEALRELAELRDMSETESSSDQNDQDENDDENDSSESEDSSDESDKSDKSDKSDESDDETKPSEDSDDSEDSDESDPTEDSDSPEDSEDSEDSDSPDETESAGTGPQDEEEEETPLDETELEGMTPEDALRLLSTLPPEDLQDLQKALRPKSGSVRLEKEW